MILEPGRYVRPLSWLRGARLDLRAALQPAGAVVPVVGHQGHTGGREHRAGEAVVEALAEDPHAALERVVADQAAA